MLELPHTISLVGQESDRQGLNGLWNLLAENRQSGFTLRGHEYALSVREIVANDICNGVGLTCTWWTLYDHACGPLQLLDDRHLFVVIWLGEI
jgi:hypothetical protein